MAPNIEEICKRCISDLAYKFGDGKKKLITRLFNKQLKLMENQSRIKIWIPSLVTGKVYRVLSRKYTSKIDNKDELISMVKESYENIPKAINKKYVKDALELLAEGHELNYSATSGRKGKARIVLDSGKKIKYEKIKLNIFFYLEKERLIDFIERDYNNFGKHRLAFKADYFEPVDIYKISYLGKSLIK